MMAATVSASKVYQRCSPMRTPIDPEPAQWEEVVNQVRAAAMWFISSLPSATESGGDRRRR